MKDSATLKWIHKVSKKAVPSLIIVSVCNALLAWLGVSFALLSRGAVDSAVSKSADSLMYFSALLIFVVLIQFVLRITSRRLEYHVLAMLEIGILRHIFAKILKKDFLTVTGYHSGDILNRLTADVNFVSNTIATLIPQMTALITRLIFAFGALCFVDLGFASIFVIGGVFVFVVSRLFRKTMKRLHANVQIATGHVRAFVQEAFENLLIVKTFGIENKIRDKSKTLTDIQYNSRMKQAAYSVYAGAGISLLFSVGYLYAVIWGASGIFNGAVTFGTLTAVLQLVNQVQSPFGAMSGILTKYYSTLASAERLIELDQLYEEPSINLNAAYPKRDFKYIQFIDVTFKYNREAVLEGINLRIDKGELILISGISGIGKSTLLKLLLAVLHPNEGEIQICFADSEAVALNSSMRGMFAYVPQGNLLLSGTIKENLMLIREDATREELERAIDISCAKEFIDSLPDNLDTVIGERGQGLSEGQIQRLAIARAILSNAPILLLDEATSALDEETEKQVLNNIKALNGVTCIIISHKNAARNICRREFFIEDKRLFEAHENET